MCKSKKFSFFWTCLKSSFFSLFLFFSAYAEERGGEKTSVSSSNAAYDGNVLVLNGHVLLDHGLGKMAADRAFLERHDGGEKEFPFSLIQLEKEVFLHLKNRGEISCEKATLDFTSLKGFLLASSPQKVVYTESLPTKHKKENVAFRVLSQNVELQLEKKGHDGEKTVYEADTIFAKEDVVIHYGTDFILQADYALYEKKSSSSPKKQTKGYLGTLTAYPKDKSRFCHIVHGEDVMDAEEVRLLLDTSQTWLKHPKGELSSGTLLPQEKGKTLFHADQLLWDQNQNTLALKGRVYVEENSLGIFTSDDQLHLMYSKKEQKRFLKTIQSKGMSTLQYKDPEKQTIHKFLCYGPLSIDRELLRANVESPRVDGVVPLDKQIFYEEKDISIYADTAFIEYAMDKATLHPVSLSLKGNIRLFSHDPKQFKRCGTADRLSYSPTTRTLIMAANPGKKVLFWEEEQGLKLSAQEIHITEDPVTKKEIVKGIGNVQFAFTGLEQEVLQKAFPFYSPSSHNVQKENAE